ncbi:hypothetical protein GQ43DRAFT_216386 [Delitschia confertaspora ATCC 74209]|uniref:Uncharacterized protein n=1 Tax=Delitschia confertaspora ATCC 74209 TaxID=1513339 RepID=A0A9P4JDB9_9PLEO|nr:hypothetical protein GQ43DRAFT_216386 [Delitschia confertaspora ATCC 74209]
MDVAKHGYGFCGRRALMVLSDTALIGSQFALHAALCEVGRLGWRDMGPWGKAKSACTKNSTQFDSNLFLHTGCLHFLCVEMLRDALLRGLRSRTLLNQQLFDLQMSIMRIKPCGGFEQHHAKEVVDSRWSQYRPARQYVPLQPRHTPVAFRKRHEVAKESFETTVRTAINGLYAFFSTFSIASRVGEREGSLDKRK